MAKTPRALLIALLLAGAAVPAIAARAVSFDAGRLSTLIRDLNLASLQGRPSFGPGQDRTTDSLVFTMRGLGLEPAGDPIGGRDGDGEQRRDWTQAVPMVRYEAIGAPRAAVTLGGRGSSLAIGSQILLRTLQPVSSVTLSAAPLVFVGYGIDDASRGWDDYKGVDLAGKVAVVLAGDPGTGAFSGVAMTWPGRWTAKIETAARHGAAGVLIVHDADAAGYGWATLQKAFAAPQYDLLRNDAASLHPRVEGWLSGEAADALFAGAGLDLPALRTEAGQARFQPRPMSGASFSAQYGVSFSQALTYNVVGRIKGQTHPDQAVVVMSHWDGSGAVESEGAAALLELARAHGAQTPNARSIVFVLTGGSQEGDLGAAYYAAHPTYSLAKTAAVVGLGPFDAAGPARDLTIYGDSSKDLSARLGAVLTARGRNASTDPDAAVGHAYRTDAFALARNGVPQITVGSGINLNNGGALAGAAWRRNYIAQRYRQPGDVWSGELDLAGLAADLDPLYVFTRDLANQADWPAAGFEFAAARAATDGDRR